MSVSNLEAFNVTFLSSALFIIAQMSDKVNNILKNNKTLLKYFFIIFFLPKWVTCGRNLKKEKVFY